MYCYKSDQRPCPRVYSVVARLRSAFVLYIQLIPDGHHFLPTIIIPFTHCYQTMVKNTVVLKGPLKLAHPPRTITTNRVLSFYAQYAVDFTTAKTTTSPTKYYASTAILVNTDQSIIHGAEAIWGYYIHLYEPFKCCVHDVISMTLLSDEGTDVHTLIVETINNLHLKNGKEPVSLPQSFVYEIAKSQRGTGMYGLQINQVRCYFDRGLLQKAAST